MGNTDNIYMIIVLIIFFIGILAIYLESRFNYPFGYYDGIVLCPIPPFIKRIRIKNKWIGFDKHWRFVFMKELNKLKGENKNEQSI